MNPTDIKNYITKFYGYGSWEQPLWFVGMEEGGVSALSDFELRLNGWLAAGGTALVSDAKAHHERIGLGHLFAPTAPIQKTWEKLIRIYFALTSQPADKESIRRFQIEKFGRPEAGFASLELFSLPAKSTGSWVYSEIPAIAELPFLINRKVYKYYLYPHRADELRRRIQAHKPKHVVIYGLEYGAEWEGIVMQKLKNSTLDGAYEAHFESTFVLVVPHPVSYGRKQNYWTEVGEYLRTH